jgi:hypothetical protein
VNTYRGRYRVVVEGRWRLFKAFLRGRYEERWSPWGGEVNDREWYDR